jgi:glycosyltransferase involved in cell wall biosynthesis
VIKKNLKDVRFDLVLYTTPPITFTRVISFIKKRDNAFSYLLLKDIFPQNAVDLNMLKKNGMLYNFFRKKERALYRVSDKIGCMSPANVAYVLKHNPEVDKSKVEVNPNSIRPLVIEELKETRAEIREKYQLPSNKKIFVYGGNLGKPQGLEFLLEVIKASKHPEVFFLIVGSGTEYPKLLNWFKEQKPTNAKLLSGLPKIEYDELLTSCDVGLIFLSKEFTIPNFPSRLLSYLEMKMPVLAATDRNTDIGAIIEANNCGFGVESGNLLEAIDRINRLAEMKEEFLELQQNAVDLLERDYQVERTYDLIVKAVQANV